MQPTTIGLDLAKHAFQMHGVDAAARLPVSPALPARPAGLPRCGAGHLACCHVLAMDLAA